MSMAILLAVLFTCVGYCFYPSRGAKYCDQRVCVSVCFSVCSHVSKNHTLKFYQIFSTLPVAVG